MEGFGGNSEQKKCVIRFTFMEINLSYDMEITWRFHSLKPYKIESGGDLEPESELKQTSYHVLSGLTSSSIQKLLVPNLSSHIQLSHSTPN